jgi:hypothetical protein
MKRSLFAVSACALALAASGVVARSGVSVTSAAANVRQLSVKVIAVRRERAATREAERLLHKFPPPPGARRAREPRGYGGVLRRSGPEPPGKVVDIHRFWRVQRSLKAVASFVRGHQVRGFKSSGAVYGTNVPHYLTWSFVWPSGSSRVPSRRLLNVTAVRLPGRTVLRVDAKSVWVYPRSRSEKVPSGVREIVLHAPKVRVKLTDPAKVQRIVRWFDALPISPPGVATMCALVPGADITLSFRSRSGLSLAQAKLPPTSAGICNAISFTIGGHPQAPLIDRYGPLRESFVGRLQRLLGVHLLLTYR